MFSTLYCTVYFGDGEGEVGREERMGGGVGIRVRGMGIE
jgi:hypothetical protein